VRGKAGAEERRDHVSRAKRDRLPKFSEVWVCVCACACETGNKGELFRLIEMCDNQKRASLPPSALG
jgi:hypothetical protein